MTRTEIETPYGPARAELHCAHEPRAALLLGHGAGGGIAAPDLVAACRAATEVGVHVALVEQPYRVAGRRAPAPAKQLDTAWLAVVEDLGMRWFDGLPLVFGGRSVGRSGGLPHVVGGPGRGRAVPRVPGAPAGQAGEDPHAGAGQRRGRHPGGAGRDRPVRHVPSPRTTARSCCFLATTR